MKQIKQFRYYGQESKNNYPTLSNFYGTLTKGNLFASHGGITHLGIQGLPGTKFYLNNSTFPIEIGFTGIYELDLEGVGNIFAIKFDGTTLDKYDNPANSNARLLIDIVFEGGV